MWRFALIVISIIWTHHVGGLEVSSVEKSCATSRHNLWVAGAGVLGSAVVNRWVQTHGPDNSVIAETRSSVRSLPVTQRLRKERSYVDYRSAANVLISIPPSADVSDEQYLEEVTEACKLWNPDSADGKLVLISSTAVYGNPGNVVVTEKSPLDSSGPKRTQTLIQAEEIVLKYSGIPLRLAGLYNLNRGPHLYWLQRGTVEGGPDGIVNLVHYDDACEAVLAVFSKGVRGQVYLASDSGALSRKDILDSAIHSNAFDTIVSDFPKFTRPSDTILGKVADSTWTMKMLGWKPRYENIRRFFQEAKQAKLKFEAHPERNGEPHLPPK